ncbi:MAG: preprotein translocase subunit SecA, partial [Alphaproteobacteria bacterium]|nr:preprotein translocase subunit SecA [Alphaproteobacteria bacterium]
MRVAQELKDVTDEAEKAARRQTIESDVLAARQQVKSAGGLFVIGTERHESRRIDNQLRGRSGRQGDPGHSKFFLSLEDDLLRIFGGDRFKTIMVKLGLRDGEKIVHPLITRAIEHAQRKVEARNFDIRKNLLKYDNIMNDQRKVVYEQRRDIMAAPDVHDMVEDMRAGLLDKMVSAAIPAHSYPEQWQLADLQEQIQEIFGLQAPVVAWGKEDNMAEAEIYD